MSNLLRGESLIAAAAHRHSNSHTTSISSSRLSEFVSYISERRREREAVSHKVVKNYCTPQLELNTNTRYYKISFRIHVFAIIVLYKSTLICSLILKLQSQISPAVAYLFALKTAYFVSSSIILYLQASARVFVRQADWNCTCASSYLFQVVALGWIIKHGEGVAKMRACFENLRGSQYSRAIFKARVRVCTSATKCNNQKGLCWRKRRRRLGRREEI